MTGLSKLVIIIFNTISILSLHFTYYDKSTYICHNKYFLFTYYDKPHFTTNNNYYFYYENVINQFIITSPILLVVITIIFITKMSTINLLNMESILLSHIYHNWNIFHPFAQTHEINSTNKKNRFHLHAQCYFKLK